MLGIAQVLEPQMLLMEKQLNMTLQMISFILQMRMEIEQI
jgi:hypothetical protein